VNDNSLGQDTNLSETEPKVFTSDAEFKNRYRLYIITGILVLAIVAALSWGGIALYKGRSQEPSTPNTSETPRKISSITPTGLSGQATFDKDGALYLVGYLDLFQSKGEFLESASIDYTLTGKIKEVLSVPIVIGNVTYPNGLILVSSSGQEQAVPFLQEELEKMTIYSTVGGELKTFEFENLKPNSTVKIVFSQNLLPKNGEKTNVEIVYFPSE